MVRMLWARLKPGASLSPLAQGREVWKARRGARSASGATPPLPQEPVGPNFAFALHFHIPSKLQLETTKLLQDSPSLRRQVDLQGWGGEGRREVRDARDGSRRSGTLRLERCPLSFLWPRKPPNSESHPLHVVCDHTGLSLRILELCCPP